MHSRALVSVLLGSMASIGCGPGEPAAAGSAEAVRSESGALFLWPAGAARLREPVRLELRSGDLHAAAVPAALPEFDPLALRVGGFQDNGLAADLDGSAGVTIAPPYAGDAMIGFSTRPVRATWRGAPAQLAFHGKALLFVASRELEAPLASAALTRRIGLRLEIVPMVDPLPLLVGDSLPLQVRFDGPSLPQAAVRVQHLRSNESPPREIALPATDEVGAVHVPIDAPGRYLVTAVHESQGAAGREVHVATLTFAIGGGR
jgi:hypothetical protein